MNTLDPRIELKDYLFGRIYTALQGDVVNWIMDKAEYGPLDKGDFTHLCQRHSKQLRSKH